MREYGVPPLALVLPSDSLAAIVFRRAETDPQAVILRRWQQGGSWRDVTASQFRTEVAALANGLIAAGIAAGDRIALMSRTRYEWTLVDYAAWAVGAVTVPVYETSSVEQVEWILRDSAVRAVFAETEAQEQVIASVRAGLPALERAWRIDDLDTVARSGTDVPADVLARRLAGIAADDLATIVYTSGTTGRPKGCELSHRCLLADVRNAVAALPELFESPGASTLLFLPLAHVFARIIQVGMLESGAVLGHWPDPNTLADGLADFRPSFVLAVPRVFEKIYYEAQRQAAARRATARAFAAAARLAVQWSEEMAAGQAAGPVRRARHAVFDMLVYRRLRAAVGGRVRYAISGGGPLSEPLGHFFGGVGITVLEGYGLTEAAGAVTVNRPGRNKVGTVGLPLPGVAIRTAADGEILVRGDNVFAGYCRNPAATREALDSDGWLRTGDVGALDDEGMLRVTGRQKELIVTAGGINVAPAVLEERVRAHPLISHCVVVGDGRPYVGCLIALDPEELEHWKQQHRRPADASASDLASDRDLVADIQRAVDDANKAVSRAESIRRFRILPGDFTTDAGQLTPSDKVRRSAVARDFAHDIEMLYA
jgi:long-chain acyl-CoA synthetase